MEINDTVVLFLPEFSSGSLATPTTTGCGTTSFEVTGGAPALTLTLTAKNLALAAGTSCTVDIASGVTTSAKAQDANLNTRTYAVTLASSDNIVATAISSSPRLPPRMLLSSLVVGNPVTTAPSSITFVFKLNVDMGIGDKARFIIPFFAWPAPPGTLGALVLSGCSSTTFTTTPDDGGDAGAKVTFQVADATLAAVSTCSITIPTGATTPPSVQVSNWVDRQVFFQLGATDDIQLISLPTSTAIVAPAVSSTVLAIANPVTNGPTAITFTFSSNARFDINDTIAIVLPNFAFSALGTYSTSGCGITTFIATASGSNTANAKLTAEIKTAQLAAASTCSLTVGTGIVAASLPQSANLTTRTVAATLANADNIPAVAIAASPVLAHPTVTASTLVIASPNTMTASSITVTFTIDAPLYSGDVVKVGLPQFSFGAFTQGAKTGCGSVVFSATSVSSTAESAAIMLTADSGTMAAFTNCELPITVGASTGPRARNANYPGRTLAVTLAQATDIPPTPIATSTPVTDITPPISNGTGTNPVHGYPNASHTDNIILGFDEPVQAGTGNVELIPTVGSTVIIPVVDGQITFSDASMIINPTLDLETHGTNYTVKFPNTAVRDAYNNYHIGLASGTYQFGVVDSLRPTLVSLVPSHEQAGVPYNTQFNLTFSEAVSLGWYAEQGITFSPSAGEAVVQPSPTTVSASGTAVSSNMVMLTIPGGLSQIGVTYTVTTSPGVVHDTSLWRNMYAGITSAGNRASASCTVTSGGVTKGVTHAKLSNVGTGLQTILTLTMTGACEVGLEVEVACTSDLRLNSGAGAVTFDMFTSADTQELTGQVGYTVVPSVGGSVTWTRATRATSTVAGQAGGDFEVEFTPTTTVPTSGTVKISPSVNMFASDAATTCTATSASYTKAVTSAATVGSDLTVTMGAPLYAGHPAKITCSDNLAVNPSAVAITFSIETSEDTTALTGQTGYTTAAGNSITWISALRSGTLASTGNPLFLTLRMRLNTRLLSGGSITVTPSVNLFSAAGAINCQVSSNGIQKTVTSSTASVPGVLTVVMGADLSVGPTVEILCFSQLALNGAAGAIVFSVVTSTDTVAASNLNGYTITPSNEVQWVSARRTISYTTGLYGGNLVIKFIPANDVSAIGGTVQITPSVNLFSGDGATSCTVTAKVGNTEGNVKGVGSSIVTSGALTVAMSSSLVKTQEVTITCSDNLVDNVAGAVTFSIQTSSDPGLITGQTGYTIITPRAVTWAGASRSGSLFAGQNGGSLKFRFTPANTIPSSGTITIKPSQNLFAQDVYTFTIPDTAGPTIGSYLPTQGYADVSISHNLVLTFGENIQAGTGAWSITPSSTTTYQVRIGTGLKYFIDDTKQKSFTFKLFNTYVLNMDHSTCGTMWSNAAPMAISETADGTHGGGQVITAGQAQHGSIVYKLNGGVVSYSVWSNTHLFASATSRSITFTPNKTGTYYYYDTAHSDVGGNITVEASSYSNVVIDTAPSAQVSYAGKVLTINPTANFLDDSATDRATLVKYDVRAPSGILKDALNNPFGGLYGDTYTFTVDHTSPQIIVFEPAAESWEIAKTTHIMLSFDELVQAGTGNILLEPYPGVANGATAIVIPVSSANVSFAANNVTIIPPYHLAGGAQYFVTMDYGVVKDASNNPFAGLKTVGHISEMYYFTIADVQLPSIVTYDPPHNFASMTLDQAITLSFDEHVQAASGNIVLTRYQGSNVLDTTGLTPLSTHTIPVLDSRQVNVVELKNVLIAQTQLFQYNSTYQVTMAAGVIQDDKPSANNFPGISGDVYLLHCPPDSVSSIITEYNPAQGAVGVASSANLVLTFNENVSAVPLSGTYNNISAGSFVLTSTNSINDISIPINDAQVSYNGNQVRIDPIKLMTSGVSYTLTLAGGLIRDTYGNMFSGIPASNYTFGVSNMCTFRLDAFTCSATECVVTYIPNDVVCENVGTLKYIATTVATTQLTNITADAAVSGEEVTVVQTSPLGIRVGKGNGLIWPEYVDPLA